MDLRKCKIHAFLHTPDILHSLWSELCCAKPADHCIHLLTSWKTTMQRSRLWCKLNFLTWYIFKVSGALHQLLSITPKCQYFYKPLKRKDIHNTTVPTGWYQKELITILSLTRSIGTLWSEPRPVGDENSFTTVEKVFFVVVVFLFF